MTTQELLVGLIGLLGGVFLTVAFLLVLVVIVVVAVTRRAAAAGVSRVNQELARQAAAASRAARTPARGPEG